MIAASAARADLAVAHEALSALDVPPSPSVASRVASLAQRTLEAEAAFYELAEEASRLRCELETVRAALRHEATLLEDLEAEAARP